MLQLNQQLGFALWGDKQPKRDVFFLCPQQES